MAQAIKLCLERSSWSALGSGLYSASRRAHACIHALIHAATKASLYGVLWCLGSFAAPKAPLCGEAGLIYQWRSRTAKGLRGLSEMFSRVQGLKALWLGCLERFRVPFARVKGVIEQQVSSQRSTSKPQAEAH